MNCKNAAYADAFGNYREAKVVQIKHHFTWKLGFVFERLAITRHVNDLSVLLLEEDHYMMTDGIHVLRQLFNKYMHTKCYYFRVSLKTCFVFTYLVFILINHVVQLGSCRTLTWSHLAISKRVSKT